MISIADTHTAARILTYVSFSKVTVADFGLSGASEAGVTDKEVILPLIGLVCQCVCRIDTIRHEA